MSGAKRYAEAGQYLSQALRGAGVTNARLAHDAGVTPPTLRSWIAGWSRPAARNTRAFAAIQHHLGDEAAGRYKDMLRQASSPASSTDSAMNRLRGFIKRGSLNEAFSDIPLVSEHPGAVELNRLLGRELFARGRVDDAQDCYVRAIELSRESGTGEDSPESLTSELASRYAADNRFTEAAEVLRRFLAEEGYAPETWYRLGVVSWYSGDLVDSLAQLGISESQGYDAGVVSHARGQVLAELGQLEAAERNLRTALTISLSARGRAYATAALGYVRFMLGAEDEGLELFEKSRHDAPDNGWLYYRVGLVYESIGNARKARQSFQKALECTTPTVVPRMRLDIESRARIMED